MTKVISLSSDFGVGNKGIAVMESVALGICPDAKIFNMSHGIPFLEYPREHVFWKQRLICQLDAM